MSTAQQLRQLRSAKIRCGDKAEIARVIAALRGSTVGAAAEALDIPRRTLERYMSDVPELATAVRRMREGK